MINNIDEIVIIPPKKMALFLMISYGIIIFSGLANLADLETFSIKWFMLPIGIVGFFFNFKKYTKKIIFDFVSKRVIIKDFVIKKIINSQDIHSFRRVQSVTNGDWYGIILKKDKYGKPIQISFPPMITTNIQNHANNFEKETLPKLNLILK